MPVTLDARLAAAAALVRPGLPVADIGCDHGKLTAALACSGLYPKVIGSDLRPDPLDKARRTVEAAGCQDRVELRLGDGLSVLSAGEVGTIVIAGVSAQTAWQMLEAAPWVFAPDGPRLVLIPATRHDELLKGNAVALTVRNIKDTGVHLALPANSSLAPAHPAQTQTHANILMCECSITLLKKKKVFHLLVRGGKLGQR